MGETVLYRTAIPAADLKKEDLGWLKLLIFVGAHIAVGVFAGRSELFSTLHALITVCVGLWVASTRPLQWSAYIGAYIVGGEVLWRMTEAHLPWEFAKYAVSLIFIVALIRAKRIRGPLLVLLYFGLLLPSVMFTAAAFEFGLARQLISFNLSGPFALLVCAGFFSNLSLSSVDVRRLTIAAIAPVVGIVTVVLTVLSALASSGQLYFGGDSNFATSGGYAPNQVSSILGLGAMLCIIYLVIGRTDKWQKVLLGSLAFLFAVQSVLTFSRSGIVMAIGGIMAATPFLVQRIKSRFTALALVLGTVAVVGFVVVPRLDMFTGAAFTARFSSLTTTNRASLIQQELDVWEAHPILGVGPGMAPIVRERMGGHGMAAHTEFTRQLSEHGILGLFSIVFFVVACARNLLRAPGTRERVLIAALVAWVFLYMLVNAFRIVAPAYLAGITFACLLLSNNWTASVRIGRDQLLRETDDRN